MKAGEDPRPDQQAEKSGKKDFPDPPPNSQPSPAPGGVGTGTAADPAKNRPESDKK